MKRASFVAALHFSPQAVRTSSEPRREAVMKAHLIAAVLREAALQQNQSAAAFRQSLNP